jgi:hypothetical protein
MIFITANSLYAAPFQQFVMEKVCTQFSPQFSAFAFNVDSLPSHCLTPEVQSESASWLMMVQVASALPALFLIGFLGKLSDTVGRRPIMIVSTLGCIFNLGVYMLVDHYDLGLWVLIPSAFVTGCTGVESSMMTAVNAYLADATTREVRSSAYGQLSALLYLGVMAGPLVGGFIVKVALDYLIHAPSLANCTKRVGFQRKLCLIRDCYYLKYSGSYLLDFLSTRIFAQKPFTRSQEAASVVSQFIQDICYILAKEKPVVDDALVDHVSCQHCCLGRCRNSFALWHSQVWLGLLRRRHCALFVYGLEALFCRAVASHSYSHSKNRRRQESHGNLSVSLWLHCQLLVHFDDGTDENSTGIYCW